MANVIKLQDLSEEREEKLIRRYMALDKNYRRASRKVKATLAFAVIAGGVAFAQEGGEPDVSRLGCRVAPQTVTSAMPCDTLSPMIKTFLPTAASGLALIALMPLMMRAGRAKKDRERFIQRFHFQ